MPGGPGTESSISLTADCRLSLMEDEDSLDWNNGRPAPGWVWEEEETTKVAEEDTATSAPDPETPRPKPRTLPRRFRPCL